MTEYNRVTRVSEGSYNLMNPSERQVCVVFGLREDCPLGRSVSFTLDSERFSPSDLDGESAYEAARIILADIEKNYLLHGGKEKAQKLVDYLTPWIDADDYERDKAEVERLRDVRRKALEQMNRAKSRIAYYESEE